PHRAVSAQPVRSWWLQHAKLVAVWVGKDVPAPSRLADRPLRQDLGTNAQQSLHLRLKVARAQVEVNPVLAVLTLGNLLEKNLGALAICWQQALIAASSNAVADVPQRSGPELCRAVQLGTVDHDNQFAPQVRMWLPAHDLILHRLVSPQTHAVVNSPWIRGIPTARASRATKRAPLPGCREGGQVGSGYGDHQSG